MAAPVGHPRYGGRKAGTPNRKTVILNEALEAVGLDVVKRLSDLLPELEPKDQAYVLMGLMEYLFPKRKAIELTGDVGMSQTMITFAEAMKQKSEALSIPAEDIRIVDESDN